MKQRYKYCLLGLLFLLLLPFEAKANGTSLLLKDNNSACFEVYYPNNAPENPNQEYSLSDFSNLIDGSFAIDDNSSLFKIYIRHLSFFEINKTPHFLPGAAKPRYIVFSDPILYYIYGLEKIVI